MVPHPILLLQICQGNLKLRSENLRTSLEPEGSTFLQQSCWAVSPLGVKSVELVNAKDVAMQSRRLMSDSPDCALTMTLERHDLDLGLAYTLCALQPGGANDLEAIVVIFLLPNSAEQASIPTLRRQISSGL